MPSLLLISDLNLYSSHHFCYSHSGTYGALSAWGLVMSDELSQLALFPGVSTLTYQPARVQKLRTRGAIVPFGRTERRFARVILASGSPSKRDILSRLGLKFEVDPANI